jgi:UDP-3-O-[3-hydroxymyristoyl] glucosamine N-acyltransferase
MVEYSLGSLAVRFGLELHGEPEVRISSVATLAQATPGSLSFLANSRYRRHLAGTRASAVVLAPADSSDCPVAALVDANPYLAYAQIAKLLYPAPVATAGIHPSAIVEPGTRIAASASVGPLCVIETDVDIGERVALGAGCTIKSGTWIGNDCRLMPRVSLYGGVRLGERCIVHSGAVIGADGFGFAPDRGTWCKVPQVGGVRIGDDVEIGANTTIDRGALEDTEIGDGVKIDNQVQIGHNVRIGEHTAIAGCAGVAGSATIGRRCMIGGAAMILGHLELADDVSISVGTVISRSILKPGLYTGFFPTSENAAWERNAAGVRQIDALRDRVRALEKQLKKGQGPE